jgi:hypothetical protein
MAVAVSYFTGLPSEFSQTDDLRSGRFLIRLAGDKQSSAPERISVAAY